MKQVKAGVLPCSPGQAPEQAGQRPAAMLTTRGDIANAGHLTTRSALVPTQQPNSPTTRPSALATHLKELRAEHGLSLAQLARATGISSSFLSLVEQGQSDITVGRLVRLAEFYKVEVTDLLDGRQEASSDHLHVLRASPEHMLRSAAEGIEVFDLAYGGRWTLVPALNVFRRGGSFEIDPEQERECMVFVLDGTFELALEGEAPARLRRGEGAIFLSVRRYRITNVGTGQGRLLGIGGPTKPNASTAE